MNKLKSKDLLGLKELEKDEILLILKTAAEMKKLLRDKNFKKLNNLANKSIVTLFYENSTRTRVSFELAGKFMGATVSSIASSASSVEKGESLIDTGKTLDALKTDAVILRHNISGSAKHLAKNVKASVINGGDGMNEHPTQALLDMFTMIEKKGDIKGLKIAIVGDIKHSRVARSNIWGLSKLGAEITMFAPETLIPAGLDKLNLKIAKNINEAVAGKDIVMALRIQSERQKSGLFPSLAEYSKFYGINEKLLSPETFIMHPGPMNRGVEISSAIADSTKSLVEEQVQNGLAVRMAILDLLLGER